jgi:hypothetical protein
MNMINDVFYKYTKLQSRILCDVGKKMTKLDKIWRFENMHTQYPHFGHFCVVQNTKYLRLRFYKFARNTIVFGFFLIAVAQKT